MLEHLQRVHCYLLLHMQENINILLQENGFVLEKFHCNRIHFCSCGINEKIYVTVMIERWTYITSFRSIMVPRDLVGWFVINYDFFPGEARGIELK